MTTVFHVHQHVHKRPHTEQDSVTRQGPQRRTWERRWSPRPPGVCFHVYDVSGTGRPVETWGGSEVTGAAEGHGSGRGVSFWGDGKFWDLTELVNMLNAAELFT